MNIKSIAHITGGSYYENLRAYNRNYSMQVSQNEILPISNLLQEKGNILDMICSYLQHGNWYGNDRPSQKMLEQYHLERSGVDISIGVMEEGDPFGRYSRMMLQYLSRRNKYKH